MMSRHSDPIHLFGQNLTPLLFSTHTYPPEQQHAAERVQI